MGKLVCLAALFSVVVAFSPAHAAESGPFGTRMGMSRAELMEALKIGPKDLRESSSPTFIATDAAILPNELFQSYAYRLTEKTGLCQVLAVARPTKDGNELLRTYDRLFDILSNKYGAPHTSWNGTGKDYNSLPIITNIFNQHRITAAFWGKKAVINSQGERTLVEIVLPGNVARIELKAVATTPETGSITLLYRFSNDNECIDVINASKSQGL